MFAQRFSLASARACRSAAVPASRSTRPAIALARRTISSTPVHFESLAGINKFVPDKASVEKRTDWPAFVQTSESTELARQGSQSEAAARRLSQSAKLGASHW